MLSPRQTPFGGAEIKTEPLGFEVRLRKRGETSILNSCMGGNVVSVSAEPDCQFP
jgi:hypothetical protein